VCSRCVTTGSASNLVATPIDCGRRRRW